MDRTFLSYYETELTHIRELAVEFAALHPTVAGNLSLDVAPCPDPYVERLLEGVAFLAARTRLKVDGESSRLVRGILDALYPDLAAPSPAVSTVVLHPGPQVQTMLHGHVVKRGTRMISAYREEVSTRATYCTAQAVTLWPVEIDSVEYLQDSSALGSAGLSATESAGAEAALRIVIRRVGQGSLADLDLDRLDINFSGGARSAAIFDCVFGWPAGILARRLENGTKAHRLAAAPSMVGTTDAEGLLPRSRTSFEGYRLIREYFLMPERFHFLRLDGLKPALRDCTSGKLEILILFARACPEIAETSARDFRLFATPVVNLFEKECNVVELDGRSTSHVVHADRTKARDFEIYRLLKVENVEDDGPDAALHDLYAADFRRGSGLVYTTERRPRRPASDEVRRGQTRTSYLGDDFFISVARPANVAPGKALRRLDIRALCTNRDLPILDDNPKLTLETGDPVGRIELLAPMRRPRASLVASLPKTGRDGETELDDLSWRLIGQLSLNHLSLVEESRNAEPLRAMLDLYADRGDPALTRHVRQITRVSSRQVIERLGIVGPLCFGQGVEVTLDIDETAVTGSSVLLLSALLNQLFARYAGINSFVRTKSRLSLRQEVVQWPMSPGIRGPI